MIAEISLLAFGLVMILCAAEGFTNGIEALGRRFSLSQAVVGSVLAAVGTALPETILPMVAIFLYEGEAAQEIGVGAILGAPFMLSTLAFFLVGLTVAVSTLAKKRSFSLVVEAHSLRRDIIFFFFMYSLAVLVPLFAGKTVALPIAILLVIGYFFYAYQTFRSESAAIEHTGEMYLWKLLGRLSIAKGASPVLPVIIIQVIGALSVMVAGAHTFVKSLAHVSESFGMSPLLFSLILAPIATELPEKFNSVTWTWKGRDTLALGNITGAMVFQSTFPVSVGLLFTGWQVTGMALFSAVLALVSAFLVFLELTFRKKLSPLTMLLGGGLYLIYAAVLVFGNG